MFSIWHKVQSSYKQTESTEFHTTEEIVNQNSFKVYCHSLCQSLKIVHSSSTCYFFHTKLRFARRGIFISIFSCHLIGNQMCYFLTNMFEYLDLGISGRMGAFKIWTAVLPRITHFIHRLCCNDIVKKRF